jgi:hypothetical protein
MEKKKWWVIGLDSLTICCLLFFNVALIVILGVALIPIIFWKLIWGEKIYER